MKGRPYYLKAFAIAIFIVSAGFYQKVFAQDKFDIMPVRYIAVKGDAAKFRALNWMDDGYTGGIRDMMMDRKINKDTRVSFEGHAIPGDNDLLGDLKIVKDNFGYLKLNYSNFRKWYDVYGGFYPGITTSNSTTNPIWRLNADPKLDIGNFNLEAGRDTEDTGVSIGYQRQTKEGIKSMQSWGNGNTSSLVRMIVPSWNEISETTDAVTLKGNTKVGGFNVEGKQRYEFFQNRSFREDSNPGAGTGSTAAVFYHDEHEPQAKLLTSSLKADKWIIDDKTYVAAAYQFVHQRNTSQETVGAFNSVRALVSSTKNRVEVSNNLYDANTWVQQLVTNVTSNFNITAKFKEQIAAHHGVTHSNPYLGGDTVDLDTKDKTITTGESVSLRYNGIPKTSLYSDLDLQQNRYSFSRQVGGTSTYYTPGIDNNPNLTADAGIRYVPNGKVNMTSQAKRESRHNTFDYYSNSDVAIAISRMQTDSNELDNRVTWKPLKWFENSFRLRLIDTIYHIQTTPQYTSGNTDWEKSQSNQRVYTYNMVVHPVEQFMCDLGYSLDNFKVSTPASQHNVGTGTTNEGVPVFTANIYTWLFTTSFIPRENLSLYSTFEYSRAKNYNGNADSTAATSAMTFGVDNERHDVQVGLKWTPKKDLSIEPHYAYYSYRSNQSVDYGNYSAHLFMLEAKYNW